MQWSQVRESTLSAFIARSFPSLLNAGHTGLEVLANPTEEIMDGIARRKPVRLFQQGAAGTASGGKARRLEENYLYATRAFQAGNLAATDHRFFQNAIGQNPAGDGFPAAVTALDDLETNMDVGGQIAQGKNFAFRQVGLSFNAGIGVANLAVMLDAGALRFSKQGDQYQLRHGPARLWPGGTGIAGFSTANAVNGAHNGAADPRAVRSLRVPRIIKQKESFSYIYHVPRTFFAADGTTTFAITAPGVLMTVWLWGGQMDVIPG
jgi:hypothetical protein